MRKSWIAVIAVAVIALAAVGGGLWWFLRDDAPEKVSLDSAVAANSGKSTDKNSDGGTDTTDTTATTVANQSAIDGTWTVDASTGAVDFETATGSFAGFRIQEELRTIGSNTAVGRTRDVSGQVTIAGDAVTAADLTVKLTTITTNESRRDDKVQSTLETGTFPEATFTLSEPITLGPGAAEGKKVSTTAKGQLTVHGVTKPVDVAIEALLKDGTVFVTGSTTINMPDFGVSPPKIGPVLSVSDQAVVEWQLLLEKA